MHHAALDRAGADDRDLDHEIVEIGGFQPRQHRLLRARLDLEHADRVGALAHRVDLGILGRNVLHRQRAPAQPRDHVEAAADRRQHPERQAIDLEEPQRVEVVLVPLDDGAIRHRRVLDRHHALQQVARDHEPADVLRQVAREAHQLVGHRDEPNDRRIGGLEAGLANALVPHLAAVPPREHAGEPIDLREIEPERLADVAHRALRPVGDEGCRQRRAVAAVLGVDVLHHLLAPLVLEVDVDVGRLVALAADEALEQHRHPRRVDFGDAERIADRRVRRRAAALAQDGFRPREGDDVVDGEEVGLVAELRDERELVLDQGAYFGRNAAAVAVRQAGFGQRAQVRGRRRAGRHDLLGILVAQLVQRERAAPRDGERFREQRRRVDRRQPRPRAQVPFAVGMKRVAAFGERFPEPDRGDGVLQRAPRARVHVDVAGGNLRQSARLR